MKPKTELNGIHDREWIEQQLKKFPDSPVYKKRLKEELHARFVRSWFE
jgi:hypothetical protein